MAILADSITQKLKRLYGRETAQLAAIWSIRQLIEMSDVK